MNAPLFSKTGMSEDLEDFAFLPRKTVGYLANYLKDDVDTAEQILKASWRIAYETGLIIDSAQRVSFPIWRDFDNNKRGELPHNELIATLSPNIHRDESWAARKEWALTYAGKDAFHLLKALADSNSSPRDLYSFAFIDWERALPEIADAAIEENWEKGEDSYGVLKSYLMYTYQKLALQGNVFVDEQNGFAAFNSGLANSHYKDLFLCFGLNSQDRPPWEYQGVCYAGERGLGKVLVDYCATLPAKASYFADVSDLVYDSSRELYVDYEHILFDNINRIPIPCIQRQLYDRPEMLLLLDALKREDATEEGWSALRAAVEGDLELSQRLLNKLELAVTLAEKRTQWNYRTAIPFYYPKGDEMSLLLPLCLQDSSTPDAALVVSRSESGNYQGETILTLEQAYTNARLICRPENDWLKP